MALEILSASQGRRNRALTKLQVIQALAAYLRGPGRTLGRSAARVKFVHECGDRYAYKTGDETRPLPLSVRSLMRWESLYAAGGADALARDGRGRPQRDKLSEDAVAMYWALRNHPNKLSLAHCHRRVAHEAAHHGWTWHRTYSACAAWDQQTRDTRALVLNREGDQRYTQRCGRYIELDPESYESGACWVGDDHDANLWVRLVNDRIVRPTLSVWQDWRSRVIVGWRVVVEGNEHSLLLGFGDGAEWYGLPETVIADNGKNFTSWQWRGDRPQRRTYRQAGELAEQAEGLLALCGVQPSWCLPYNPNGKARLERWFRTVNEQFCKNFPSYCGSSPADRPEAHAKLVRRAVPFDTFAAKLREYVEIYNNTPHSGDGMNGKTPQQVMALAPRKRLLSDDIRPLLLAAWHRPISVGRNGVALRVCGATVRYGAAEPALRELPIGTKVRVAYDPQDVGTITVWTMDYRFLCHAAANERLDRALPAEALRETMRAIAREKRALRQAREVGTDYLRNPVDRSLAALARDAARRRLPDPPGPDGGPVLIPVQTPLEPPFRAVAMARKAVGAESMTEGTDALQRLEKFARKPSAKRPATEPAFAALARWSERQRER